MKEGYGARLGAVDVLFSICSPWKVGIDAFGIPSPGSWLDRVVVIHFNLDYSYPNMKNSDIFQYILMYNQLFHRKPFLF